MTTDHGGESRCRISMQVVRVFQVEKADKGALAYEGFKLILVKGKVSKGLLYFIFESLGWTGCRGEDVQYSLYCSCDLLL